MPGKSELLKTIESGKGIQHILNAAYKILGNPMLIFDMEYNLIAYPDGAENDDSIWNEFMTYGRLSYETVSFFKEEAFIDHVANSVLFDGVTYLISDKLKYDRICGVLYNKENMPVADLCAVACEADFEEDTPEQIKTLCAIISKELGENDFYHEYGNSYQDMIVGKLIEGAIEDKGIYTGHVSNIDKGLKAYIFLAVVDAVRCSFAHSELEHYRSLLRDSIPDFKYSVYDGRIVILMSSDNGEDDLQQYLNKLTVVLEREDIYAGVSGSFENLFMLDKYYKEAVNALEYGKKNHSERRIFLYRDIV